MKIYYRKSLMDKTELAAAKSAGFECVDLLSDIKPGDFVIPRYSLYPFVFDQQRELKSIGAKVINSYNQHVYIADLQNYVADLKELTPQTWDNLSDLPEGKSFILKGQTNSKKDYWNTHMYAVDKQAAIKVESNLMADGLIGGQKIYIREYIPLHTYMYGIGGIPITKEFRFFVANKQVITGAFYWGNYADEIEIPSIEEVPKEFLQEVISRIGDNCNFYAVDVAQTKEGNWIVVELNDGSQSGLSMNDPEKLYNFKFLSSNFY